MDSITNLLAQFDFKNKFWESFTLVIVGGAVLMYVTAFFFHFDLVVQLGSGVLLGLAYGAYLESYRVNAAGKLLRLPFIVSSISTFLATYLLLHLSSVTELFCIGAALGVFFGIQTENGVRFFDGEKQNAFISEKIAPFFSDKETNLLSDK